MKTRGEISQERKDTHAAVQAKFDKYLVTASKFADSIDCDLPELTELPAGKNLRVSALINAQILIPVISCRSRRGRRKGFATK